MKAIATVNFKGCWIAREGSKKKLIEVFLRNRTHLLNEDDIEYIAEKLENYSGADIELIIDRAAFIAFEKREERKNIGIIREDIEKAIEETPPSVSIEEVERIEEWARNRGVI